jgi:hypothetical protein
MAKPTIGASLLALWTSLSVPAVMAQQGSVVPITGVLDTTVPQRLTLWYQLYLPPGYAAGAERWPLILFHGAGERGDDFTALARQVLPELAACTESGFWPSKGMGRSTSKGSRRSMVHRSSTSSPFWPRLAAAESVISHQRAAMACGFKAPRIRARWWKLCRTA